MLTLRETLSTIWDMDAGFPAVDLAPNTSLLPPWGLPPITSLTAVSGTSTCMVQSDGTVRPRVLVTWSALTDPRVAQNGYVEVRYWRSGDSSNQYQTARALGYDAQIFLDGVVDKAQYIITARSVSAVTVGNWCPQITHIVDGKTVAPSNVTGLSQLIVYGAVFLTWNLPSDLDYARTELRIGASWAAGTPLTGSIPTTVRGTQYLWAWPALGSYTVWAKHYDTSGNASATAASVAVTVDARINLHDAVTASASAVSITTPKHTPDGTAWRTLIASMSYTPTQNCQAVLLATGSGSYTTSSGNDTAVFLGAFQESTLDPTHFLSGYVVRTPVGVSTGWSFAISDSITVSLTAGVAYTFNYYGADWASGDTCTVDNLLLRLDVLKGV
jgi:hypothetical protein